MKYAVLIVFDYSQIPASWKGPGVLLSMEKDIYRMYATATELGVPSEFIWLVTDVKLRSPPWGRLPAQKQPQVASVKLPLANVVIDTLAQVMSEISVNNADRSELLFYYSGHGVSFETQAGKQESHLVLMNSKGERRYLSHTGLNTILSPSNVEECTRIPVVSARNGFLVLSSLDVNLTHEVLNNHRRLYLIDACQSQTITGLPFVSLNGSADIIEMPAMYSLDFGMGCVVTELNQNAPSSTDGSPFTTQISRILRSKVSLTAEEFRTRVYSGLHSSLKGRCRPVFTLSRLNWSEKIPFSS